MERITSAAAQVIIAIIPIVGIVIGALVIFSYLFLYHRRRTLLISAGRFDQPNFNLRSFSLLTGLLLSCVGIAVTVLLAIIEGASYGLLGGLIPLSVGIGLLIYYWMKRGEKPHGQ